VRKNLLWSGLLPLALACSTSTRIRGNEDGGLDGQGGSSGSGSAGSGGGGGTGGSSAADAGADGGADGGADSAAPDGPDGSDGGRCVPTDVTIDFAAQGNLRRPRFERPGVSLVGIAELQFSDHTAAEPDAGLGVVGGLFDWSIDSTEFVTFSFTRPATNVTIFLSHALDIDNDGVFGKSTITAFDAAGQQLAPSDVAGYGKKNVSALFGDGPISKFMVKDDVDGIAIGSLSFTECLP
jgi:hypothetical protein